MMQEGDVFKLFKKPLVFIQQLLCFKHEFEYERTLIGDESSSNEEWLKVCRKCNKEIEL